MTATRPRGEASRRACPALHVFVDALRGVLGLEPLYRRGRPPVDAVRFYVHPYELPARPSGRSRAG